jgi:hypothetical protein
MAAVQDLQAFRQVIEVFYASFTPADWVRKHGKDWTFADPLYHLTTIHRALLDSIQGGEIMDDISKMRDMDAWNDQQFAARPASMTPQQMLADFLTTWKELETAASQHPADEIVYMPLMRLRGERPLDLLLEYALWHAWLHLTESSLRHNNQVLKLPAALQTRLVEFFLIVIAGMIDKQEAKGAPFAWAIRITGEGQGEWTMRFANGTATVERGLASDANITITADLGTFLKTNVYQMQSQVWAVLTRRMRVKGMGQVRRLGRLMRPRRSRDWAALPENYRLLPST